MSDSCVVLRLGGLALTWPGIGGAVFGGDGEGGRCQHGGQKSGFHLGGMGIDGLEDRTKVMITNGGAVKGMSKFEEQHETSD